MDKKKGLTLPKMLFKGAFVYNPVLTQAIGVCTVVAICFTLKISIIVSLNLAFILVVNEILASLFLKKLSRWMRVVCYMLISTLLLLPMMLVFDRSFSQLNAAMGIYLPLLAVNSLVVIRCEKYAVKNSVKYSLFDALSAGLGYFVVAVIVGIVREIFAYGTVFGKTVTNIPNFSGMALPFGGLIVLGFFAAFHKWIIRKYFTDQPTNTFSLKTVFDTPLTHEEGIRATSGTLSILENPSSAKKAASGKDNAEAVKEEAENTVSQTEANPEENTPEEENTAAAQSVTEKEEKDGEEQ